MIALTRRSTRARYAQRGRWRTTNPSVEQALRRELDVADESQPGLVAFVLRDGTVLDVGRDPQLGRSLEHRDIAERLGYGSRVDRILETGVARVNVNDRHNFSGVQISRPLSAAQAESVRRLMTQVHGSVAFDVWNQRGYVFSDRASATPSGVARLIREANEAAA